MEPAAVKSFYGLPVEFEFGPPLMGALLRIPWQQLRDRQLEGLRQRGFADLHEAYLTVFQWPGPQGLRPTELAARTRTSRQAINHLLGQLEVLGYLQRQSLPGANQGKRIELTARGEALGHALREVVTEVEREWAQRLGRERLDQLRALLTELCDIVEPGHTR